MVSIDQAVTLQRIRAAQLNIGNISCLSSLVGSEEELLTYLRGIKWF